MAPSRKSSGLEAPMAWKLPAELLRDIIGRTNHQTLVRYAAACKLLRRDILSPPLDCRVTQAAPYILAGLCNDAQNPLVLVHPSTPTASSFCHEHLSPFLSRKAVKTLLDEYKPVASRHGLVVLCRRYLKDQPRSDDMCLYDPMSGTQRFFSYPPEIQRDRCSNYKYVLLTAADGIHTSSFMLFAFDLHGSNLRVPTFFSCGTWESVTYETFNPGYYFPSRSLCERGDPSILNGGVIHWLSHGGYQITSYDLRTGKGGSVGLPNTNRSYGNQLYLATSSDGKLLKLLTIQVFKMFVWLQLPDSALDGSGWSLETVIDMEEKLRSLDPRITDGRVAFEGSGKRNGDVVILEEVGYGSYYSDALIVFDLDTKKMHRQKWGFWLLEIDLPSRLQNMKIFS